MNIKKRLDTGLYEVFLVEGYEAPIARIDSEVSKQALWLQLSDAGLTPLRDSIDCRELDAMYAIWKAQQH